MSSTPGPGSSSSLYLRLRERYGSDHNPRISLARTAQPILPAIDAGTRFAPLSQDDGSERSASLEVWDLDLRRSLAMKRLRGAETAGPAFDRFVDEAQTTARLDHPGVAPVHDFGLDRESQPFFTTTITRGQSFAAVLEDMRGGVEDWPLDRAIDVLIRAGETVAFAHDRGVVHGKLGAGEIQVGRFGEAWIHGWGQAVAESDSTPASDLHALGEVLGEILESADDRAAPGELRSIRDRAIGRGGERYTGVDTLVADLRAHRDRRVVKAHATGAFAEFRKWIHRNRAVAIAGGLALATLLAGTVSTWLLLQREQVAAERAEASARVGLDAIDTMLSRVGESRLRHVPQMDRVRAGLLEDALALLQALDEPSQRTYPIEIAAAHHRIGALQASLGRPRAARATFLREVQLLQALTAAAPGMQTAASMLLRARAKAAYALKDLGDVDAAIDGIRAAIEAADRFAAQHATSDIFERRRLQAASSLAGLLLTDGQLEPAKRAFVDIVDAWSGRAEDDSDTVAARRLAEGLGDLGQVTGMLGDVDRAAVHYGRALEQFERLAARHPEDPHIRSRATHHANNFAAILLDAKRYDETIAALSPVLERARQLVREHPLRTDYRIVLASAIGNLGSAYERRGDLEESVPLKEESYAIERAALVLAPEVADLQRFFLHGGLSLGLVLMKLERDTRAIEIVDDLDERPFLDTPARFKLAMLLAWGGKFARGRGETDRAEILEQRALAGLRSACESGFRRLGLLRFHAFDTVRNRPEFESLQAEFSTRK